MSTKKCEYEPCSKVYTPKRADGKYCSATCRNKSLHAKKGLSGAVNSAVNNPLLRADNTNMANFGNGGIPQWIFSEKLELIRNLQTELKEAIAENKRLETDYRDLKQTKAIDDKTRELEDNTKPSPLAGLTESLLTPEGITALMSGIAALRNTPSTQAAIPMPQSASVDASKQPFVTAALNAISNCKNTATLGKATFMFTNALTEGWEPWLNAVYADLEKQAQTKPNP